MAVEPQVTHVHAAADGDAIQHGLDEIERVGFQILYRQFVRPASPCRDDLQSTHGLILPVLDQLGIGRCADGLSIQVQHICPGIELARAVDHTLRLDEGLVTF